MAHCHVVPRADIDPALPDLLRSVAGCPPSLLLKSPQFSTSCHLNPDHFQGDSTLGSWTGDPAVPVTHRVGQPLSTQRRGGLPETPTPSPAVRPGACWLPLSAASDRWDPFSSPWTPPLGPDSGGLCRPPAKPHGRLRGGCDRGVPRLRGARLRDVTHRASPTCSVTQGPGLGPRGSQTSQPWAPGRAQTSYSSQGHFLPSPAPQVAEWGVGRGTAGAFWGMGP